MPKKVNVLSKFEGGMNTAFHSKDIDPRSGQHILVRNFMVDIKGKLRVVGEGTNVADNTFPFIIDKDYLSKDHSSTSFSVSPGDEIFIFSSDKNLAGDDSLETFAVWVSRDSGTVYISPKSFSGTLGHGWYALRTPASDGYPDITGLVGIAHGSITGSTNSNNSYSQHPDKAAFYFDNGALRVANTNFGTASFIGDNTNTNGASSLWFGHIKRNILGGGNDGIAADEWNLYPTSIMAPTTANFPLVSADSEALNLSAGTMGLTCTVGDKDSGSLKMKGRKFYASFDYDGMQQSLLSPVVCSVPDTDVPIESWTPNVLAWTTGTLYTEGQIVTHEESSGSGTIYEFTCTSNVVSPNEAQPPYGGPHYEVTNQHPINSEGVTQGAFIDTVSDGTRSFSLKLNVRKATGSLLLPSASGGNRITAVNIYTKRFKGQSSATIEEPDWAYVCKFDLTGTVGYIGQSGADYSWVASNTDNMQVTTDTFSNSFPETYMIKTGMFADTKSLNARWKKSVIMNRILYAADVLVMDPEAETERHFPDRIIKSLPNQFDVFPTGNHIDVMVNDGENVVKLEAFGNKLLQFKNKTLYVINATGGREYLESTHKHRGIDNESSSATSPYGVFWANQHGLWIYEGKGIKSLLTEKLHIDDWKSFYPTQAEIVNGAECILNYLPSENQLLIYPSDATAGYILDVESMAFTKFTGDYIIGAATDRSKVFDVDGVSYWCQEDEDNIIQFKKWNSTPIRDHSSIDPVIDAGVGDYKFISAETDLGNPAELKRIYSVYVTYRTNLAVTGWLLKIFHDGVAYNNGDDWILPNTSNDWSTKEFSIDADDLGTVECTNCYIELRNYNAIPDMALEVSDFTIVYRPKKTFGRVTSS